MTQNQKVLKELQENEFITQPMIYRKFFITRLAARINDLKYAGFEVGDIGVDQYKFKKYILKNKK